MTFLQGLIVRADSEIALMHEIEDLRTQTEDDNVRLLGVAVQIAGYLRALSFLAVNARIEAARFGEQGKGFAVIAGDIASLVRDNSKWVEDLGKILDAHQSTSKDLPDRKLF